MDPFALAMQITGNRFTFPPVNTGGLELPPSFSPPYPVDTFTRNYQSSPYTAPFYNNVIPTPGVGPQFMPNSGGVYGGFYGNVIPVPPEDWGQQVIPGSNYGGGTAPFYGFPYVYGISSPNGQAAGESPPLVAYPTGPYMSNINYPRDSFNLNNSSAGNGNNPS